MERKKTQATTAKLKKVQTEIKKTKDKLNKLIIEIYFFVHKKVTFVKKLNLNLLHDIV